MSMVFGKCWQKEQGCVAAGGGSNGQQPAEGSGVAEQQTDGG